MNNLTIRLETEKDYRAVEELTREAFWNVYKPGADEHYYVHIMRSHPDFIPELAFVLEKDGEIVGNIMYTKAWLKDENGERKEILSFGGNVVSKVSTAAVSSQQSAAVLGMYIQFLPSSAPGTSSATSSAVGKLPGTIKLIFFFLQLTNPRLT